MLKPQVFLNILLHLVDRVNKSLVHMATGSLCRFFKSQMGVSIFDYLNKIKVDYACSLLLNNDLSIADIAYDCGLIISVTSTNNSKS
jgi:AraC-like DNA-binding protein